MLILKLAHISSYHIRFILIEKLYITLLNEQYISQCYTHNRPDIALCSGTLRPAPDFRLDDECLLAVNLYLYCARPRVPFRR